MWKGNPHRDHPLKIVAVITGIVVLYLLIGVLILWVFGRGTWDPLGIRAQIDDLFRRYPIGMSSVYLAISAAFFVYDYRSIPPNIHTGRRRLPPLATLVLIVTGLAFICIVTLS